ncbi:tetratricopeptide repeat protein [Puniceicoccaceae bacterium K14]|nr:tetratricopeptide repeat protein [Puniceicoccaceae bacterium K14]
MSDLAAETLAKVIEMESAGKAVEALEILDQAIAGGLEDVLIYSRRGKLLEFLQRYEQAFSSFSKAASIESNFRDHYNAGNMLLILKQYEEAIVAFEQSIICRADYPECWTNKGIAHHSLEQFDDARICFAEALKTDPEFTPALRCKAILYSSLGDESTSCEFYEKAAQLQPDKASAWFEYGCALYRNLGEGQVFFEPNGPEGKTIQVFDKVIELQPDTQGAWGRKIGVLFRLADAAIAAERAAGDGTDAPKIFPLIQGELLQTAQTACERFPDDQWFADRRKEAEELSS